MNIHKILKAGLEQHKKNMFDLAEASYLKVLKLDQGNVIALKFLAEIFSQSNRSKDAIACLKKVFKKDKLDLDAQITYALMLLKEKEFLTARLVLKNIIDLSGNLEIAHCLSAIAFTGEEQFEEAIKSASISLELNKNNFDALHARALSYAQIDRHQEAIQDYDSAIEIDPTLAELYCGRGQSYNKLNDHHCAASDLIKSIELEKTILSHISKSS